ncbi:UDP-N-acetyl-alpha-D-glucosamine C6 dehydratase [Candidatus Izimaplasma bacterium HR1]|jgi:FlaA1/EpsC-like NDP-sugar epimerase|uniref:polysaccharide biosynthesis protein n=1 Tax=Candidatus Izimoplasma sp. HR1 TaxID=1541959 RepID=UPI0004F60F50|nr:UDP-N-acetyl-alpha-D-glucosamine C6 dehydratase [Candidatus Izimaplasma bacterium HR1]
MKFLQERTNDFIKRLNIKTIALFFIDAVAIGISFFIALLVKNDLNISVELINSFFSELPIIILIYWVVFELFQMYKSLWDFAGFEEVIKGVIANVVATIIAYLLVRLIFSDHLSFGFYLTALFIAAFFTLSTRMFYRILRVFKKLFEYEDQNMKALIVGAGSAGSLVLKEIQKNMKFESMIIGFLDDDETKQGRSIHSVPVLGTITDAQHIISQYNVNIVYVAIPNASKKRVSEILNVLESASVQIKLFPPFYEMMIEGGSNVTLRDIRIEDLLGREEIQLEKTGIREYIDSKIVMVTGGGGSIGSELVRQLRGFNPSKIVIIDMYENTTYDLQQELERLYQSNKVKHKPEIVVRIANVRDFTRIDEIMNEFKPNVVFHAAAHKHVPLMEISPREALKNNVLGTYNVALLSDSYSVEKFVLISTDKAVRPTNIMGASKRIAEKIVMSLNQNSKTEYSAVRFGNVLGSNGSVIPLFKKQILEGGPVTVTHPEITRFFMTIPEASQLVIQAGAYAQGGDLFVLDMGEPIKIRDLAEKMIRLSGQEPHVEMKIEFTGLRPGEKMYEELLIDSSTITKTTNNKIFIEKNNNGFTETLDNVISLKETINHIDVIKFVKENVRSYIGKK